MSRLAKFHPQAEVRTGSDPRTATTLARGTFANLMVAGLEPSKAIRCQWGVRRVGLHVHLQPWFAMAYGVTWYSAGFYRIPLARYLWLKLCRAIDVATKLEPERGPVDPMPTARTVRR